MNQATRDLLYTQSKFTQKGSTAYVATEGAQQKSAKNLYNTVLEVDVKCTPKQLESIANSLPHEILTYNPPAKRGFEAHAHLSFLTSYVQSNVMSMDFSGQVVKVVGPKFNKKEIAAYSTAESVHFCLNDPMRTDEFRQLSSARAVSKLLAKEMKERELTLEILRASEASAKKINLAHSSVDVQSALAKVSEISDMLVEYEEKGKQIVKLQEWSRLLTSGSIEASETICTVGAQCCPAKADVYISNDSLYDIDLRALVGNATRNGVREIWATAILPFGLKYVRSYYSSELDVHFVRRLPPSPPIHSKIMRAALSAADPTGCVAMFDWARDFKKALTVDFTSEEAVGFTMFHGSDMSNGYVHDNPSFLKLLYTNYVVSSSDVVWAYEIVQNVAEICCMRFVRVDTLMLKTIVRKEVPSCFNDFYVVYDPLKYFAKYPTYELVLVPKKKLNSAVFMVQRAESGNKIVEKVLGHVQSTFLKVEVGGGVLQEGGEANLELVDILVLLALIEGSARKHAIGEAWKKSNWNGNFCTTVMRSFCDYVNSLWATHFPGLTAFFTHSAAKKYMSSVVDLSTTSMESVVDTSSFSFWWDLLCAEFDDKKKKIFLERHSLLSLMKDPSIIAREYRSVVSSRSARKDIQEKFLGNKRGLMEKTDQIVAERLALEEQVESMKKRLREIERWVTGNEEAEAERAAAIEAIDDGDEAVREYPEATDRKPLVAGTPKVPVGVSTGLQDSIAVRDGVLKTQDLRLPDVEIAPTGPTFLAQQIEYASRSRVRDVAKVPGDGVAGTDSELKTLRTRALDVDGLTGVKLQRARKDVGKTCESRTIAPDGTDRSATLALNSRDAAKLTSRAIELGISEALHDPFSYVAGIPEPDDATQRAFAFNQMRRRDGKLVLLGEPEKRKLRESFTVEGRLSAPTVTEEEAREYIRLIYQQYFVEAGYDCAEMLRKCKSNMQALAKRVYEGGDFAELANKKLNVVNGYAGSGKTSYALQNFDAHTCAYIVPFAGVLADAREDIKRKYRDAENQEVSVSAKTFENISKADGSLDILSSGDELVIDECSGIPVELLVLIILATSYKKYTLIGDVEQTAYFDTLGTLSGKQFTSLVPAECVTRFRFTYRYGPTVAAFLNHTFNYPVVSLRNEDTRLVYHSEDEVRSGLVGFNLCVSAKTRTRYEKVLTNINCSGSTQGRTVQRANVILSKGDARDFLAYRESGIVCSTRSTTELHLYLDLESKAKKSVNHLLDFQTNYAAIFDVVIPVQADF